MTDACVIQGSYADFKLVKTRSTYQLVVEGPIEEAEEVIRKFGIPQPGKEIPVAVARIQPPPVKDEERAERVEKTPADARLDTPSKSDAAKERYLLQDDMAKAVTRAALLCKDKQFWKWSALANSEAEAQDFLRNMLGIKSRSEIGSNETAYRRFLDIEFQYRGHAEIRS